MIDLSKVSACLITKDEIYPKEILNHISQFPFGEILILTHSDSPGRKHDLFIKAKHDLLYYQDDDAICPIVELSLQGEENILNVAMKQGHYDAHLYTKATMGLGWGVIFPKEMLKSLKKYVDVYGEDEVFKRDYDRILTHLNFPQNRLVLPIIDLPSAYAEDRLWRQPNHQDFKLLAEQRCNKL